MVDASQVVVTQVENQAETDETISITQALQQSPEKGRRKTNPATMHTPSSASSDSKMFLNQFIYCYGNYDVMEELVYKELRDRGIILKPIIQVEDADADAYGHDAKDQHRESVEVSFHEERAMYTVN